MPGQGQENVPARMAWSRARGATGHWVGRARARCQSPRRGGGCLRRRSGLAQGSGAWCGQWGLHAGAAGGPRQREHLWRTVNTGFSREERDDKPGKAEGRDELRGAGWDPKAWIWMCGFQYTARYRQVQNPCVWVWRGEGKRGMATLHWCGRTFLLVEST